MNVEPATSQAKIEPLALNLTDAAALLGCTLSCLRRLLWANKLKYIRLGKRFVSKRTVRTVLTMAMC